MVKHSGDHVSLLVTGSAEQCIINDEHIFAVCIRQISHKVVHYSGGQYCDKAKPVCLCTVEKPVEGIFTEAFAEGIRLDLHVQTAGIEDISDHITKNNHDRDALFLAGIALSEKLSDMKHRKEILDN
mgnify:CR=1 FL=1